MQHTRMPRSALLHTLDPTRVTEQGAASDHFSKVTMILKKRIFYLLSGGWKQSQLSWGREAGFRAVTWHSCRASLKPHFVINKLNIKQSFAQAELKSSLNNATQHRLCARNLIYKRLYSDPCGDRCVRVRVCECLSMHRCLRSLS